MNAEGEEQAQPVMSLLALPGDLVKEVARRAGAGTRQLSTELEVAYGPLHGLRPDGITTLPEMLHMLQRLAKHPALKALDMSHVGRFVTDGSVQLLADSVPALQQLTIGRRCWTLTDAGLAAMPRLQELTSLDLFEWKAFGADSLRTVVQLHSLRRLSVNLSSACIRATQASSLFALSALQQLSHLQVAAARSVSVAQTYHLLAASANMLNLVALHLDNMPVFGTTATGALLARHSVLTSLRIDCETNDNTATDDMPSLFAAIGRMTDLEHLSLQAYASQPVRAVLERECLSQLPKLRSLTLVSGCGACFAPAVRASAASLAEVRLLGSCCDPAKLACLSQLHGTLQVLHLTFGIPIQQEAHPPDLYPFLSSFPRLSDLSLTRCPLTLPTTPRALALPPSGPLPFALLTSLAVTSPSQHDIRGWVTHRVAHITTLRTLSLVDCGLDDAAVESLTSLQCLELLDIQSNDLIQGHGLRSLRQLPRLKELAMHLKSLDRTFAHQNLLPPPPALCRVRVLCANDTAMRALCVALLPHCEVLSYQ